MIEKPQFKIAWDGRKFNIVLPMSGGTAVEVEAEPKIVSVIRVREAGARSWGLGFVTPLNGCSFVGAKPNTEYEVKVAHMNADTFKEGKAAVQKLRTSSEGVISAGGGGGEK